MRPIVAILSATVWISLHEFIAVVIFFIARRSSVLETGILAWSVGFVLMWLVVGNLGMLPLSILPYAIPWSMVEVFGAVWIVKKVA